MNSCQVDHAPVLAAIARDAGVTAWVHATRLGGPSGCIGLAETDQVAIASLYKLPLALVWADLVDEGDLDPAAVMHMPAKHRLPGPTGIAMLLDDVTMSQRDVVRLMLAVSDNTGGDTILALIGLDRVHHHLEELGLPATLVRQGSAEETHAMMSDTGADGWAAAQRALADPDRDIGTSQYDPAYASAASATDLTTALKILWARTGHAHAVVRDAMAHQAWRHRIGSGFPHDDVPVFGKTGSLGRLRHETSVVQFPYEHPIAVTVLTRAVRPERHLPRVDAAIGELARTAVTPLRMPSPSRQTRSE